MSDATQDDVHHSHGVGVMNALVPLARDLRHGIPEVMKAFGELLRSRSVIDAMDASPHMHEVQPNKVQLNQKSPRRSELPY